MKGFLSRISKNPERRFKRYVRYRKTGRTRQTAGARKQSPKAADAFVVHGQTAAWGSFGAMLLREDAGGYVLVGVVSFAAAAAITALCFRLRNRENCRKGGEDKPARHEKEEKSQ